MRPFRSRRLLAACQRILVIFALGFAAEAALAQSRATSGTVVDQDGQPVPRALVRIVDAGRDSVGVFADDRGRFELTVPQTTDCRIVASLVGFETAEAPCASEPLRLAGCLPGRTGVLQLHHGRGASDPGRGDGRLIAVSATRR